MKKILITLLIFFALSSGVVFASYPVATRYINDFANVVSPTAEGAINKKLTDYDKKTTNQIVVATVKTTGDEPIEEYSIHLAEQWKPGVKGKDNGVIMLFAMNDRKMRIEVGRGLEGELTDTEARQIEDNIIRPEFKAQKYDLGIQKGVDAVIIAVGKANFTATPTIDNGTKVIMGLVVLVVIIGLLLLIAYSPATPLGGEGDWGYSGAWSPSSGSSWGGDDDSDSSSDDGGGFSGGGGSFSGGGATSSW